MWALLALTLVPGREKIPGADVFAGTVQGLHVFVTRPSGVTGRVPVLFEVAWPSCDSVEQPKGPEDGFTQLIWDLAARYALTGGQLHHGEPALDQMLVMRPTPSAAGYASSVLGLVLGGSGSHGGGGVT